MHMIFSLTVVCVRGVNVNHCVCDLDVNRCVYVETVISSLDLD